MLYLFKALDTLDLSPTSGFAVLKAISSFRQVWKR